MRGVPSGAPHPTPSIGASPRLQGTAANQSDPGPPATARNVRKICPHARGRRHPDAEGLHLAQPSRRPTLASVPRDESPSRRGRCSTVSSEATRDRRPWLRRSQRRSAFCREWTRSWLPPFRSGSAPPLTATRQSCFAIAFAKASTSGRAALLPPARWTRVTERPTLPTQALSVTPIGPSASRAKLPSWTGVPSLA
jgi:hypothetical protein